MTAELTETQRARRRKQARDGMETALRATYSDWGTQTPPALDIAADVALDSLGDLAAEILTDGTMLRGLEIVNGVATLSLEPATEILKIFVASMRGVLDEYGAENYVETEMSAPSVSMDLRDGSNPMDSYTVTIQRRQNPTPHQFRLQAEARAKKAEAELTENVGVIQALRRQRDEAEAAVGRVRAAADALGDGTEAGFRAAQAVRDALEAVEAER